ncbi:MAG: cyclophilin-like fold protein [Halobacteria archaeon]|nr:cyclophilin-like fold protein [Halobacteria archaeon]
MSDSELRITVDGETLGASWLDKNSETREAIRDALPLEGRATRWGDELYFDTPVDVPTENAQEEVPVGGVAYWSQGNAVCLFWGSTPASEGDEPRAASPVNLFAEMENVEPLERLDGGGADVRIEDT